MHVNSLSKRLFLAFDIHAPWPSTYPPGRLLNPLERHLTIAFLGNQNLEQMIALLNSLPLPPFAIGPSGILSKLLFLPPDQTRVVAYYFDFGLQAEELRKYTQSAEDFFVEKGFELNRHPHFLPHVTVARAPLRAGEWEKAFKILPAFIQNLHLYQSLGNLHYQKIWTYPLKPPFEEVPHTADMAFIVRGNDLNDLAQNAALALQFHYPALVKFSLPTFYTSLDDIIIALNQLVSQADQEFGIPFKAISFHGNVQIQLDKTIEWEMIVDV